MSSNDTDLVVGATEPRSMDGDPAKAPATPIQIVHRLLRGRYWIAIALAAVFAGTGGYLGYKATKPTYESTGLIRIKPSLPRILYQNEQNGVMPLFDAFVESQVALMRSQRVVDLAMQHQDWKELGRGLSPEQVVKFSESLEAFHPPGTELVVVTFEDLDPEAARRAVMSVIDAYDRLYGENDSESAQSRLKLLEERRTTLTAEYKKWNEQIHKSSDNGSSESVEFLYHASLQRMLKLEAQLEEFELARSLNAGATTRPVKKSISVEMLAMKVPEIGRLVATQRDLEWQIAVNRKQLGENHRSVLDARARLDALAPQLAETVEFYQHFLMNEAENEMPTLTGLTPQQLDQNEAKIRTAYGRVKAETEELGRKYMDLETLKTRADETRAKLNETNQRIDQLNTEAGIGGRISVVSRGDRPLSPTKDNRIKLGAAGALGGGGLGIGLVLLFGFFDRRIRTLSDVQDPLLPGQRILGVLPLMPEEPTDSEDAMMAAHSIHHIRMLLQRRLQSTGAPVISITSASPGAGKTSLTLALGLSFAASGARTLLIDCDIIGGGLTSKMKKSSRRRLGHILRRLKLITTEQLVAAKKEAQQRGERLGETLVRRGLVSQDDIDRALELQHDAFVGLREALQGDPPNECISGTGTPRLSLMPLGSAQRQHVSQLSYPALRRVIEQVRGWFDVVIIDTGPILGSLEASVAAMASDGVVLTVAKGEHRPLVQTAMEQLQAAGGRLAGIVVNRVHAGEILASGLSSSASRRSSSPQDPTSVTAVAQVDHKYLRLGPISNAVVALAEFSETGENN